MVQGDGEKDDLDVTSPQVLQVKLPGVLGAPQCVVWATSIVQINQCNEGEGGGGGGMMGILKPVIKITLPLSTTPPPSPSAAPPSSFCVASWAQQM